jgi:hypothetical protein
MVAVAAVIIEGLIRILEDQAIFGRRVYRYSANWRMTPSDHVRFGHCRHFGSMPATLGHAEQQRSHHRSPGRNDLGFRPGYLVDDFQFTAFGKVPFLTIISRITFGTEPL